MSMIHLTDNKSGSSHRSNSSSSDGGSGSDGDGESSPRRHFPRLHINVESSPVTLSPRLSPPLIANKNHLAVAVAISPAVASSTSPIDCLAPSSTPSSGVVSPHSPSLLGSQLLFQLSALSVSESSSVSPRPHHRHLSPSKSRGDAANRLLLVLSPSSASNPPVDAATLKVPFSAVTDSTATSSTVSSRRHRRPAVVQHHQHTHKQQRQPHKHRQAVVVVPPNTPTYGQQRYNSASAAVTATTLPAESSPADSSSVFSSDAIMVMSAQCPLTDSDGCSTSPYCSPRKRRQCPLRVPSRVEIPSHYRRIGSGSPIVPFKFAVTTTYVPSSAPSAAPVVIPSSGEHESGYGSRLWRAWLGTGTTSMVSCVSAAGLLICSPVRPLPALPSVVVPSSSSIVAARADSHSSDPTCMKSSVLRSSHSHNVIIPFRKTSTLTYDVDVAAALPWHDNQRDQEPEELFNQRSADMDDHALMADQEEQNHDALRLADMDAEDGEQWQEDTSAASFLDAASNHRAIRSFSVPSIPEAWSVAAPSAPSRSGPEDEVSLEMGQEDLVASHEDDSLHRVRRGLQLSARAQVRSSVDDSSCPASNAFTSSTTLSHTLQLPTLSHVHYCQSPGLGPSGHRVVMLSPRPVGSLPSPTQLSAPTLSPAPLHFLSRTPTHSSGPGTPGHGHRRFPSSTSTASSDSTESTSDYSTCSCLSSLSSASWSPSSSSPVTAHAFAASPTSMAAVTAAAAAAIHQMRITMVAPAAAMAPAGSAAATAPVCCASTLSSPAVASGWRRHSCGDAFGCEGKPGGFVSRDDSRAEQLGVAQSQYIHTHMFSVPVHLRWLATNWRDQQLQHSGLPPTYPRSVPSPSTPPPPQQQHSAPRGIKVTDIKGLVNHVYCSASVASTSTICLDSQSPAVTFEDASMSHCMQSTHHDQSLPSSVVLMSPCVSPAAAAYPHFRGLGDNATAENVDAIGSTAEVSAQSA